MVYEIGEGYASMNLSRIHVWLSSSYWSPGISLEKVTKAALHSSLLVGAFLDGEQVGYTRIVSDQTTFAWVCDVYVDEAHRGHGLAKMMVRYAQEHPDYQGLRRWILATRDAHDVYAACGFEPLWEPERWMIYWPNGSPTKR